MKVRKSSNGQAVRVFARNEARRLYIPARHSFFSRGTSSALMVMTVKEGMKQTTVRIKKIADRRSNEPFSTEKSNL